MFKPKPRSLRSVLIRAALWPVFTFLIPVGLMLHFMPVNMTYATPESPESATVSKAQKAFDKAMEQCKPLPEGTLPGGVVMDTVDKKAFYSEDAHTVDAGFQYAIAQYMKAEVIPGDEYIVGVTLCK